MDCRWEMVGCGEADGSKEELNFHSAYGTLLECLIMLLHFLPFIRLAFMLNGYDGGFFMFIWLSIT